MMPVNVSLQGLTMRARDIARIWLEKDHALIFMILGTYIHAVTELIITILRIYYRAA